MNRVYLYQAFISHIERFLAQYGDVSEEYTITASQLRAFYNRQVPHDYPAISIPTLGKCLIYLGHRHGTNGIDGIYHGFRLKCNAYDIMTAK